MWVGLLDISLRLDSSQEGPQVPTGRFADKTTHNSVLMLPFFYTILIGSITFSFHFGHD
jgi:hypothetical protein